MTETFETRTCPWTGQNFPAQKIAGQEKVFASNGARAEAHKAARQYGMWLIECGHLSWPALKRWSEGPATAYTPRRSAADDQPALPGIQSGDAA